MSDRSLQVSQFASGCVVCPWQVGVAVVDGPVVVAPVVVVEVTSPTYSVDAEVV